MAHLRVSPVLRVMQPIGRSHRKSAMPYSQSVIDDAVVTRVVLPPQSPNLNAYAKRWVRSVKEEALSRVILCGERSLRHVLKEYTAHYREERPHQGKGYVVLIPSSTQGGQRNGPIRCRKRLGGLLTYYDRAAA